MYVKVCQSLLFLGIKLFPGYAKWGNKRISNYDKFALVSARKIQNVISQAVVVSTLGHYTTAEGNWAEFKSV